VVTHRDLWRALSATGSAWRLPRAAHVRHSAPPAGLECQRFDESSDPHSHPIPVW